MDFRPAAVISLAEVFPGAVDDCRGIVQTPSLTEGQGNFVFKPPSISQRSIDTVVCIAAYVKRLGANTLVVVLIVLGPRQKLGDLFSSRRCCASSSLEHGSGNSRRDFRGRESRQVNVETEAPAPKLVTNF